MNSLECPGCQQPLEANHKLTQCPRCGHRLAASVSPSTEFLEMAQTGPPPAFPTRVAKTTVATAKVDHKSPSPKERVSASSSAVADPQRTVNWPGDNPLPDKIDQDLTAFLAPPQEADELGRLGSYRILQILGAGGMGVVYLAEDQSLRRPVAIKAMLPAVAANPINRHRFEREAQALARVKNEHVITIYQVGSERGIPFLAMEYLEGEALDLRLARDKLIPAAEAVRIARETADGLASAHASGLIHRDIKPANLWLVQPRGKIVILDFGLARVIEDDVSLTRAGMILGTPAFMSPEQARSQPVDARSDLFSLGIVLYRMVTGKLPFHGTDAFATLSALTLEEPPLVWDLNPDVPYGLGKLISQLMAKNPEERPRNANEVVQALTVIENELRNPSTTLSNLFAPLKPKRAAETMEADLGAIDLKEDEDILEVEELEVLPDEPEPGSPAPLLPSQRLNELTGHSLGCYEIGRVLGQGHYGVVFHARDRRNGKVLALKVLSPDFPKNDAEAQQFTQAMGPALALHHPNLVSLIAAGKTGPYCWIAQEYIEGQSLERTLLELDAGSKDSWHFGLRVAIHIAQALDYTRNHRLIHGNITPKNILVRGSDKAALLNDLRIFRALKGSRLHYAMMDQKLTAERNYLAPEQVESGKSYVDFLCDLYSLGSIVYHLITGQPTFQSESLRDAIVTLHETTPTRPRKFQKTIPRVFEFAVMRMLAKRQEDRYQSAAEVLADLSPVAHAHGIKV